MQNVVQKIGPHQGTECQEKDCRANCRIPPIAGEGPHCGKSDAENQQTEQKQAELVGKQTESKHAGKGRQKQIRPIRDGVGIGETWAQRTP